MSRRARSRPDPRARVVVLLSGTGSLCAALLEATDDPAYPARVVAVGSDRDAEGLAHTTAPGAAHVCLPRSPATGRPGTGRCPRPSPRTSPTWWCRPASCGSSAPAVLDRYEGRLVNTHPALLPAFPGAHAVRDALAAGVPVTGATVHLVDAGVDTGPVLAQREVPVEPGDDEATLHERIKTEERALLVETVAALATAQTRGTR